MGTYFEAVVELDEGPYPIISNMDESQTLSGQLDVTDIRTRAVFAFIRDAPRRVWWVSDYTAFYTELAAEWSGRLGAGYFHHSTIPADVPASVLQYPIVINVDKTEFFDGSRWDGCPLPVLTASYPHGPLPEGWEALGGRWHGDRIAVRTRAAATLGELTEILAPPAVSALTDDPRRGPSGRPSPRLSGHESPRLFAAVLDRFPDMQESAR